MSKKLIIVVLYPDQGVVNDPEPLMLPFAKALHSLMHIFHIVQFGGNDQPQPRRCALSECFVY